MFQNRDKVRGGGVGIDLNNIKFKRRKDIEKLQPDVEHIWLEIPGRNKNSKLSLGVYIVLKNVAGTNVAGRV